MTKKYQFIKGWVFKLDRKKLIAVMLLCMTAIFSLYSQNNSSENQAPLTEESIVIADDAVSNAANPQNNYKGPSTLGTFIRMIVVLILVIAIIYGVFWFIKKKTNIVKTDDDYLRRAAYINIAPGKTIEVITLVDKAYVIGVTEDGITLLGELDSKADDKTAQMINAMNLRADQTQNTKKPLNFNDVMDMFLAKKGKVRNVFSEEEQHVEDILKRTSSNTEENHENS
jgi:flagellar protein FliO/FliZ